MTTLGRVGAIVAIVAGLLLVAAATGLIVLAYNLSRDGFAAWPEPAYVPAAGGLVGLAMIVLGVVSLWRGRAGRPQSPQDSIRPQPTSTSGSSR